MKSIIAGLIAFAALSASAADCYNIEAYKGITEVGDIALGGRSATKVCISPIRGIPNAQQVHLYDSRGEIITFFGTGSAENFDVTNSNKHEEDLTGINVKFPSKKSVMVIKYKGEARSYDLSKKLTSP